MYARARRKREAHPSDSATSSQDNVAVMLSVPAEQPVRAFSDDQKQVSEIDWIYSGCCISK
jgi:hypothetical protein